MSSAGIRSQSSRAPLPAGSPAARSGRVRRAWEWRLAALKNGAQDAMAYRVEFLLGVFGSAFVPAAIQMVMWWAMFQAGGQTEVAGRTYGEFVNYTLASILFSQIRGGDHDFELVELIRTGTLSQYLLRPVNVIEFVYIRGVAEKLIITGFVLVIGLMIVPFTALSPERLLGALFLAFLGNIIHYLIGSALAAVAFLWEEAHSVLMVKNLVVSILSGELIPLYLVPVAFAWVWQSTPFYLYVFGPTEYALGNWTHAEFLHHLGIAFAWLGGALALCWGTWKLGIRRYQSLGG